MSKLVSFLLKSLQADAIAKQETTSIGARVLFLSSGAPSLSYQSSVKAKNMFSDLAIWYQQLSDGQMYEAYHIRPREYQIHGYYY